MKTKKKIKSKTKPTIKPLQAVLTLGVVVLVLLQFTVWGLRLSPLVKAENIVMALNDFHHPDRPFIMMSQKPQLISPSYILVDVPTNQILLEQNSSRKIYPASTTKLITALTALNLYPLDEVVTVGSTYPEGKIMELQTGEKITIRSLVTALLVYSANDAAFNLATHHLQGTSGFVTEMNNLVKKYNLSGTHFTNFDGIDNSNHYSTAYDLSQIGRLSIKNPIIRDTVKNKKITVADTSGQITHQLESTNELLDITPEIKGLKTGWTPDAGGSFVALMDINGHELISVVTQSDDRFGDTRKLLDWAKANVIWQPYQP